MDKRYVPPPRIQTKRFLNRIEWKGFGWMKGSPLNVKNFELHWTKRHSFDRKDFQLICLFSFLFSFSIMNVLKSHTFQHFFNDMDRSASGNSCGQHNGIGLHHNTSNAGQSLNASSSVLTYRSNRRSVDRSDNKSQNDMGSSQRHAANGVNHHAKGAASANDCNTNQLHKDRTNSNNTNSSSGHHHQHTTPTSGAYHSSILNGASRLSELIFTSIFSTIKYRLIGGPDCNEPNDINLVLNNHSTDRIDDDVPNECNDIISLNNAMGSGGAAVVAMSQSSTQTNSNSFTTITSSLSNGKFYFFF